MHRQAFLKTKQNLETKENQEPKVFFSSILNVSRRYPIFQNCQDWQLDRTRRRAFETVPLLFDCNLGSDKEQIFNQYLFRWISHTCKHHQFPMSEFLKLYIDIRASIQDQKSPLIRKFKKNAHHTMIQTFSEILNWLNEASIEYRHRILPYR